MTFRDKIRNVVYTQYIAAAGSNASPATVASMAAAADNVADAVANSVHDDLIDRLEAVNSALAAFVLVFQGWTPVAEAALKAALGPAMIELAQASAELTEAVGEYK